MMRGVVNGGYEATIRLTVQDVSGQAHAVDAVIDTGFTGFLSLPPALIATLGLPWLCPQQGVLADGSIEVFDVYAGIVI
jgi:predicted aspartyl protease